ncbi:hypothetical protein GCM10022254_70490 [Actinomadura meridiana]|uniref:Uncharacterized protein n=1 Tax=Actinomadura meridiana TaxID=559626 RepID=A0ABP8CNI1_9ACTN
MSFGKGRHAATPRAVPPRNDRRTYLFELDAAVRTHPELAGGLVERRGVTWVSVAGHGGPRRTVEIGCDFRDGQWWFCWAADGRPIRPARDVAQTLDAVASALGGSVRSRTRG